MTDIDSSRCSSTSALNFDRLLQLFDSTHVEFQRRAARAVNQNLVIRNWLFGWYIVEFEQNGTDRAKYGKETLERLSSELKLRIGRGFSVDNLQLMRRFYTGFFGVLEISETPSRILPGIYETLSTELATEGGAASSSSEKPQLTTMIDALADRFSLSWSHYVTLLTIDNIDERRFYEIEAGHNQWSVRELDRQIDSALYQRLALSRDKEEIRQLARQGQVIAKAADLIKNPLVLEFLDLDEKASYSESELESAIIDKLQAFMLELGKGFLFESRQKRFTFDDKHFRVDLVLYNRLLRCYVLLDLKIGEITHGDLGQMQMYVNYFDRKVKLDDELPTVGIVLCARKNDALVELTLPREANIFASKYQLYLPSKEELKRELERIETDLE
ncbi:PDDEXK nuclease domain-containing protein [Stieleria sp. TO1_6]|uniref:PDDEXK nuclease domain-containing protein n=1 Tax=Stieleria tagensis TaxID=2956795 RepID=UPI00209B5899|nr:PDDEXK nuclease domain-containing protein [Stieleria tagensis]MCO8124749.1 PDDEXK nuclease domain-containing protein [Stieleria tagensis]